VHIHEVHGNAKKLNDAVFLLFMVDLHEIFSKIVCANVRKFYENVHL